MGQLLPIEKYGELGGHKQFSILYNDVPTILWMLQKESLNRHLR